MNEKKDINSNNSKIAIVHDDLIQYGGAERVVEVFHEIWPQAPIYTSLYDTESMTSRGWDDSDMDIRTSHYQWLPQKKKFGNKFYLPIYPLSFESFDFSEYDIVISSSTRFSHGIITRPETCHISYCHSPARFLWDFAEYEESHGTIKSWQKPLLFPILNWLRIWDQLASERVDYYIGNSTIVQKRIGKRYKRKSEVIHPPVEVDSFIPKNKVEKENYYLIVSRLAGHKRVDLAVKTFNLLGNEYKLKIAGSGDERSKLESLAKDNIEFLGFISDEEKINLMQKAKAFLYPQIEDFGITAVESLASGTPVIGVGKGGILDTVKNGKTGLYFDSQTPENMANAIQKFEKMKFDSDLCISSAREFTKEKFKERLKRYVEKCSKEYFSNLS